MRVLIVSEGKHELGNERVDGALVILVRRLLKRDAEFAWERVSSRKIRVHRRPGKLTELEKRILSWARFTLRRSFDALVLVIDQDGFKEREERLRSAEKNCARVAVSVALGIAIQTFDAWMLADEQALSKVLESPVARQRNPESLSDPKTLCIRLRDESSKSSSLTELYGAIAEVADLRTLENRCPRGFAPFAERVRALRVSKQRD